MQPQVVIKVLNYQAMIVKRISNHANSMNNNKRTYRIELESLQTLFDISRGRKLLGIGYIESFLDQKVTKNGKKTTHDCLDVKNILPTKTLINISTNNRCNSRTENCTTSKKKLISLTCNFFNFIKAYPKM